MVEQIPAHICFNIYTHHMAPIADDILQAGTDGVTRQQQQHYGKESAKQVLGQQFVESVAGTVGKGQIYQCDTQGADDIKNEQLQMLFIITQKNGNIVFLESFALHD